MQITYKGKIYIPGKGNQSSMEQIIINSIRDGNLTEKADEVEDIDYLPDFDWVYHYNQGQLESEQARQIENITVSVNRLINTNNKKYGNKNN